MILIGTRLTKVQLASVSSCSFLYATLKQTLNQGDSSPGGGSRHVTTKVLRLPHIFNRQSQANRPGVAGGCMYVLILPFRWVLQSRYSISHTENHLPLPSQLFLSRLSWHHRCFPSLEYRCYCLMDNDRRSSYSSIFDAAYPGQFSLIMICLSTDINFSLRRFVS